MKRAGTSTSSHKIILKPGLGRGGATIITRRSATPAVQTPASYPEDADDADEDDVHAKREESEGVLDEEEPAVEGTDVDMEGEGELEGGVDDGHDAARGRGRPKGRTRGGTPALASSTPAARVRGKGRGRGRGRGRGKGLTARFSGEGGEGELDGEEGEEGGRAWRRVGDKVCYIEGDEFVMESDEKGDQKIDIDGNLLDGECSSCFVSDSPGLTEL